MHLRFNWRLVSIRFIHDRLETYLRSRTRGGQSYRNRIKINTEDLSPPTRALNWVRSCELATGGISVDYYSQKAYPEVTGYLLPTLLQYGERALASRLLQWLLCVQRRDGSFPGPDDALPYIFDTGQVLRGLLAFADLEIRAEDAARRSLHYLVSQMRDLGKSGFGIRYGDEIPEPVHLYVLPPLIEAATRFKDKEALLLANNCLNHFLAHPALNRLEDLTHFLAYQLEALIELKKNDLVLPVLGKLQKLQEKNGAVRGREGVSWVCSPGLAQLALCWYRCGFWEPADRAMGWLERKQKSSGGFKGSYGHGANYFPRRQLSWTAKFYLDAHLSRVTSFIDRKADKFPGEIAETDGRLKAVMSKIRPRDCIAEIGCGKGRFLKSVQREYPGVKCFGLDISPLLLSQLPPEIETRRGSLEQIPVDDESFDVVFSVEAIEHSANVEAAIEEMVRVTRQGGWIIVVDKERGSWGRLDCPSWERWPSTDDLVRFLNRTCDEVSHKAVGYDGHKADGLMVVWWGRKRSRLTGNEWNNILLGPNEESDVTDRIRFSRLTPWAQEVFLATAHGQRVLEVGSGTGEISLALAQGGRNICALDICPSSLRFTKSCATSIDVNVEAVAADATKHLPFATGSFDCVWSSGLLEHFDQAERQLMLREFARVSSELVVIIVPNAASVAYRTGKAMQEEAGTWKYGLEMPLRTLVQDFEAAHLKVISEDSIGERHALNFLGRAHRLGKALSPWVESQNAFDWNQGYLLITVGRKISN